MNLHLLLHRQNSFIQICNLGGPIDIHLVQEIDWRPKVIDTMLLYISFYKTDLCYIGIDSDLGPLHLGC